MRLLYAEGSVRATLRWPPARRLEGCVVEPDPQFVPQLPEYPSQFDPGVTRMRTAVFACIAGALACIGVLGSSRLAEAYYSHAGTSYYLADSYGKKAYLWPTGTWNSWNGPYYITNPFITTEINVMNSDQLSCWYVAVVGPWGDNNDDSADRTMNYSNTPFIHTSTWSTAYVGGDSTWETTFSSVGHAGCSYYTVASGSYNSFHVNSGATTGYDDPYPNYSTSYP